MAFLTANGESSQVPLCYPPSLELLDRLKGLAERTEAKIVLTSHGLILLDALPQDTLACRLSTAPPTCRGRHEEIKTWLAENQDVGRFVVIDDECDGLESLLLFQPDADVGLSYEIVVGVERSYERN